MSEAFKNLLQEETFTTVKFPAYESIVYILSCRSSESKPFWPFYVGESGRGMRRLGDYQTSPFAAQTDFKVGKAIKALSALGYEIHVHYITSEDRRRDESTWIGRLEAGGYCLLNRLPGYNYRTAEKSVEEARIVDFVHRLHQKFSTSDNASNA